ncbi:MAG: hypothetical protein ACNA7J_13250, partial [Wenzhouxiangella sp.]
MNGHTNQASQEDPCAVYSGQQADMRPVGHCKKKRSTSRNGCQGDQINTEHSELRFVGHVSSDFRPGLEHTIAELELGEHVEVTGMVGRDRALELLAGSHAALVLAQGQEVMVP